MRRKAIGRGSAKRETRRRHAHEFSTLPSFERRGVSRDAIPAQLDSEGLQGGDDGYARPQLPVGHALHTRGP
jgi:hypothetical protein